MNQKFMDGVVYVRHRALLVDDAEWDEFVCTVDAHLSAGGSLKLLVLTDNAGPNVIQRGQLNDLLTSKGATLRIAVLSKSMVVRGIVTALSWMGTMRIRAFSPRDFKGALSFLDAKVSPADAERIFGEIEIFVG